MIVLMIKNLERWIFENNWLQLLLKRKLHEAINNHEYFMQGKLILKLSKKY